MAESAEGNDPVKEEHRPLKEEQTTEDPVEQAERVAEKISSPEQPRGTLGRRFNRKSPFFIGMTASAGVAVTWVLLQAISTASSVLVMIGLAFFLALGLDPAAVWLTNHRLPRWAAVSLVFITLVATIAGFVAAAFPPLAEQTRQLIAAVPQYWQQAQDHSSALGRLNDRFHIQNAINNALNRDAGSWLDSVVTASSTVLQGIVDTLIVLVLTVYFLADLPRIRATIYRLIPDSRRPRAILIGDELIAKVGAYVLGNVVTSVIAGLASFVWLASFHVPYPLLFGIFVALFDLIPVIGSTVAGTVSAAAALTVSLPVCLGTIAFFIAYRLAEDYLLVPRVIGRAVDVPALTTVVAVLIGGALLGIVGALVAIPVAAAIQLLAREILFPSLDKA